MTQPAARSKAPLAFAVLGLLAALTVGGAYAYREWWGRNELGPEQTVHEFLASVITRDEERIEAVVCAGWDADQAIQRTRDAIPEGANVTWSDLRLVSAGNGRAVVRATLGLRPFFDQDISDRIPWTFNLVDEKGWRVCEARRMR